MNTHADLERELLKAYDKIFASQKEGIAQWAVHKISPDKLNEPVTPTIPFVGKNYADQNIRILVYASAEVLSDYYIGSNNKRPYLDNDDYAQNRHRHHFELSEEYFPNVHIQPMNDGTLATAILYIAMKFMNIDNITPREFYEKIAMGNYCKYTMLTVHQRNLCTGLGDFGKDINTDYTQLSKRKAQEYMKVSHPFLEADIRKLAPDLIIMPEKLYYWDKSFMDELADSVGAKIIGIYQMGPMPINCTIPKNNEPVDFEKLPCVIQEWHKNIKRVSKDKYKHVYTYLDKKLSSCAFDFQKKCY